MNGNIEESGSIKTFLSNVQNELAHFCMLDQSETLLRVVELVLEKEKLGGRVHFTGIGKSSHVAAYIASLFSSTGTPAYFLDATEAVHGSAGQVKSQDIVFCISNSGETPELKVTMRALQENSVSLVAVTGTPNSWIEKNVEITLMAKIENEGGPLNRAPRASVIIQIVLLQTLSVLLQQAKDITLPQYIKWHPSGKLGKI